MQISYLALTLRIRGNMPAQSSISSPTTRKHTDCNTTIVLFIREEEEICGPIISRV